jgi:hypothetical protein
MIMPNQHFFDFNGEADISNWKVEDDVVMGGRSDGHFKMEDGHGCFYGEVSLENNGGFSSVRYVNGEKMDISTFTHVVLRVKGDGKRYQLRFKSDQSERASYVDYIQTSGEWESLKLKLSDFEPIFHGEKMEIPNYPAEVMTEFGILIGNEEAESFKLLIDWVGFE